MFEFEADKFVMIPENISENQIVVYDTQEIRLSTFGDVYVKKFKPPNNM